MLKNKNNFEIINWFFHCYTENFSEHPRILSLGYSGRGVKLTTCLLLVANLRMNGAIPFLPLCYYCVDMYNFTVSLNISALRPAVNE